MNNILLYWKQVNGNYYRTVYKNNYYYGASIYTDTLGCNIYNLDILHTEFFRAKSVEQAKFCVDEKLRKLGWKLLDDNDKLMVLL